MDRHTDVLSGNAFWKICIIWTNLVEGHTKTICAKLCSYQLSSFWQYYFYKVFSINTKEKLTMPLVAVLLPEKWTFCAKLFSNCFGLVVFIVFPIYIHVYTVQKLDPLPGSHAFWWTIIWTILVESHTITICAKLSFNWSCSFWREEICFLIFLINTKCINSAPILVSSADNLCKQFGPRSGLTKCRVWSGSKLCDTLMVSLIEFLRKLLFKKKTAGKKKTCKISHGQ